MTRISHIVRFGTLAIAVAGAIAIAAPDAAAQPRGGRRGGGPSTRVVVAPPIYYYGYGVYDPFWGAMWSPYGGWYGPWGPWDRPLPYDPNQSSARVQVKPKNAEVYVDGGLRRGRHLLCALAMGARAAMLGRPIVWGLASGGTEGVRGVVETLRGELERAMALCGVRALAEIDRDLLAPPRGSRS